jgi:multicomponent Na+:H+ antiporter subunit D
LLVSFLTLFSMTKIWAGVFWGDPESAPPLDEGRTHGGPPLMVFATGVTVFLSIAYVIFAGPIYELAERAGSDLMNPRLYIDAVLGGER